MAHAQIDDYFIQHLYLLTRNEIAVYLYLRRCCNLETKQCNPRQKVICAALNLPPSRVSEAIKNLEEKEWLIADAQGNFILLDEVTESVKKVTKFVTTKVTNSVTKVTNSVNEVTKLVTENYEISNLDKMNLKRQLTDNEKTKNRQSANANRRAKIPIEFCIDEKMRSWAVEKVPGLNVDYETENFVDHYSNKGEAGLDWVAKWRTWMRNAFTDFGKYPDGKPECKPNQNGGTNGNGNKTGTYQNGNNPPTGHGTNSRPPERTTAETLAAIGASPKI